jgi:hypothetical protein
MMYTLDESRLVANSASLNAAFGSCVGLLVMMLDRGLRVIFEDLTQGGPKRQGCPRKLHTCATQT